MSLKIDTKGLDDKLGKLSERLTYAVLMQADTQAKEIESYAKSNRRWTDRTGLAKANLRCTVSQPRKNLVRITLAHGVNYGIWLELANEKRYAIVKPTLDIYGPRVMSNFRNLLSQVKV